MISKAVFARHVAKVMRDSALRMAELAEELWNPAFCSQDAINDAKDFAKSLRMAADRLEDHIPEDA